MVTAVKTQKTDSTTFSWLSRLASSLIFNKWPK